MSENETEGEELEGEGEESGAEGSEGEEGEEGAESAESAEGEEGEVAAEGEESEGGEEGAEAEGEAEASASQWLGRARDTVIDLGGQAIGELERVGLRYPVKQYESEVDARLYRGSRVDADQMAELQQQLGIRGIVNLCLENDNDSGPAADLGLEALHIPILDNGSPTDAQAWQFIDFCRGVAPVYVHCEAGKGRTGTMVAIYRIVIDRWSLDDALAEYETKGGMLPNQERFLRAFAAALPADDGAQSATG